MGFEVGSRDETTLIRLLERLLDVARRETDAYGVYDCLPVNKAQVKQAPRGEQERGIVPGIARQFE